MSGRGYLVMDVDWRERAVWFVGVTDWWELGWFVGVTVGVHAGVVSLLCAALALVERYKLFQEAKIQIKPVNVSQPKLWMCLHQLAFLHFVLQPAGLPAFYAIMKWRGMHFSAPNPSWWEVCAQLPLFLLAEDTVFYWLHRLFHLPFLYKRFHKLHHRYHQPVGLNAEYFHTFEYLFAVSIPNFIGPLLLKSHIMTFWIWLVIRLAEGIDGHCGYDFWFVPFRYFPFRPGANIHDYHHSHNVGNYGSFFMFWDRICGTDVSYQNYREREVKGDSLK